MIKSAQQMSIAEKKATNSRKKATINKKMNKSANTQIRIAKQEANDNHKINDQRIRITGQEANGNHKPRNNPISIAERKAKHSRKSNKIAIANQNKTIMGTRISENTVSCDKDS